MKAWFTEKYVNTMATTIITAEIDPLNNDGMMLVGKLKGAGVIVASKNYDGVTHEFFGMAALVPRRKRLRHKGGSSTKKSFWKIV